MVDTKTAVDWRGHEMVDLDGTKIGTIVDIYVDSETNEPEWATVKMGLFGIRHTFVPIRNATSEGEIVRVPFEKELVKEAPNIDPEQQLGQGEERDLYGHYGIDYSRDRSETQLPEEPRAGAPEGGATPDRTGEADPGAGIAAGAAAAEGRRTEGDDPQGTARDADPAARAAAREGRRTEGDELQGTTPDADPAAGTAAGEGEPGESEDDEGHAPAPQPGERGVADPEEAREDSPEEPGAPAREADAPEVRLRLKKYVVQDEVTIPVEREEVRVEREE